MFPIQGGTKYACNISHDGDQTCLQYRSHWGLDMLAILVTLGTRHACNIGHVRDQICLQCQSRWGLDMPAMSVIKGTKYACNIDNKGDQTCLQYQLRWGLDMLAIFSNGDQICLQSLKIFKFISSQPGSLPVKSDWLKRCVIKMRILWSNQI